MSQTDPASHLSESQIKDQLRGLRTPQTKHFEQCAWCQSRSVKLQNKDDGEISIGSIIELEAITWNSQPGAADNLSNDASTQEALALTNNNNALNSSEFDLASTPLHEPFEHELSSSPTVLKAWVHESQLAPGRVIEGFEVKRFLGGGGMAEVYLVRHQTLHSSYALKVMKPLGKNLGRLTMRFMREGRIQSQLKHPNILRAHSTVEVDGLPGIILDYVEGSTLEEFITQRHPIPIHEIEELATGILMGVQKFHSAGIVHRDLKPANILVSVVAGRPIPLIADFGLATAGYFSEPRDGIIRGAVTRTGAVMGTPAYMPPEQSEDAKNVDSRADINSIGAIFFEMVTGSQLRDSKNPKTDLYYVQHAAAEMDKRQDLPDRIKEAILGALLPLEVRTQDVASMFGAWETTDKDTVPSKTVRIEHPDPLVAKTPQNRRITPRTIKFAIGLLIVTLMSVSAGFLFGMVLWKYQVLSAIPSMHPSVRQLEPTNSMVQVNEQPSEVVNPKTKLHEAHQTEHPPTTKEVRSDDTPKIKVRQTNILQKNASTTNDLEPAEVVTPFTTEPPPNKPSPSKAQPPPSKAQGLWEGSCDKIDLSLDIRQPSEGTFYGNLKLPENGIRLAFEGKVKSDIVWFSEGKFKFMGEVVGENVEGDLTYDGDSTECVLRR